MAIKKTDRQPDYTKKTNKLLPQRRDIAVIKSYSAASTTLMKPKNFAKIAIKCRFNDRRRKKHG